ncbi:Low-density lipoprotein receptor-related protein 2 [Stylophora pistillata]|uniref:Low-density lipoprotein receptor-related protein 2 n=1 Tax=Stylophora pistillata TaxID=50429 RepID=A0A2B4SF32_STYPI|nr:Low-density lipoprotein receptor-related protein 2 [Stylophora pistillata]
MMHWALLTFAVTIVTIEITDAKPYIRDRKYTENPGKGACANNRYRCEGGNKCIPLKWICDGVHDCDDKLDERNCFTGNETSIPAYINAREIGEAQDIIDGTSRSGISGCPRSTYSCDEGQKCLLMSSLCDDMSDCHDGTDEKNCPLKPGKSLAHAAEEAAMTAAQEAKRAAAAAEDMMLLARRAAEKASRALKIAEDYGAKKP